MACWLQVAAVSVVAPQMLAALRGLAALRPPPAAHAPGSKQHVPRYAAQRVVVVVVVVGAAQQGREGGGGLSHRLLKQPCQTGTALCPSLSARFTVAAGCVALRCGI